jgi:hypothetical protein
MLLKLKILMMFSLAPRQCKSRAVRVRREDLDVRGAASHGAEFTFDLKAQSHRIAA